MDSTASITYGYNRLGQNRNVVHGNTTYLNEYSDEGALTRQLISGGPLHGTILEQQFDDQGRRTQFKAGLPHQQNIVHHYGYDDRGRMASVRQDERAAHYSYDDQSGALVSTRFETAGKPIAETAREFDALGRLTHISTRSLNQHGDFYQSFDYSYNATNQRTRVETEDGSYWDYRYDDLGQVISAKRHWKDGTPIAGQQFEYDFDGIGNRKAARYGGDPEGENLAEIRYTNGDDDATQIGTIEHPGTTYVTGSANEGVTVNGQPTERQGTYFSNAVETDNSAGASIETIRIDATEDDQTDTQSRNTFVPARTTQFRYDPDGNLLFDGRWHYKWNGENRLIEMRSADIKGGRHLKLEFSYDHLGRRISKRVTETFDGHQPTATLRHFLYDGWNLVAELDTTGRALRTHLWGLDLSGTPQGAGGVGGLISTTNTTTDQAVFISFDGNGNVTGELESDLGRTVATASYDTFGNVATRIGESVSSSSFSTKFLDAETGLLYYGFRYLCLTEGRWLSRDPIGEAGGANLYRFVGNDGVNRKDYLGLDDVPNGATWYRFKIKADGDTQTMQGMEYFELKEGEDRCEVVVKIPLYIQALTMPDDDNNPKNNKIYPELANLVGPHLKKEMQDAVDSIWNTPPWWFVCDPPGSNCPNGVKIKIQLDFSRINNRRAYVVRVFDSELLDLDLRSNQFAWDVVDWNNESPTWKEGFQALIAHEVGHWLGNVDEYGIVSDVTLGSKSSKATGMPEPSLARDWTQSIRKTVERLAFLLALWGEVLLEIKQL